MAKVYVFDHPLIQHKLTYIRETQTGTKEFRELVDEVATLMAFEITRDMPLEEIEIETPVAKTKSNVLSGKKLGIVPILRAGIGMVDGVLKLIPAAKVGHIGLYRDEETLLPHTYYFKLPVDVKDGPVILVDPAFATGGSAEASIQFLKDAGCKDIRFMCIFAAKQGVDLVHSKHPEVKIYAANYTDEPLNEKGYIVKAAGDAGDRICGTVSYKPNK